MPGFFIPRGEGLEAPSSAHNFKKNRGTAARCYSNSGPLRSCRHVPALVRPFRRVLRAGAFADPGLVGTWRGQAGGQAVELTLKGDSSGSFNGQPLQYQVQGRQLVVGISGGINSYFFERKGDQLTVGGGDLDAPLNLRRGKAGDATAKAPAGKESAGARAGASAADLAGKWCYLANFNANSGGGSQTSECFVLHPDGRYDYASERSMSAYGGGAYGATSGQSADAGRWTATASSITARSNSGRSSTYALTRQNHPKNRDPMICLDGRCYVTYYKKAPW